MTMNELAKMCNVSVSTVSKAFSEADDISKETKDLILETAKQTGCYSRYYKGKYYKKIIAVIVPEIVSQYYNIFLNHFRSLTEKQNCIMLIATYDFNESKQLELIDYFSSYLRVDGILVFSLRNKLKKAYNTPIVSLFSTIDEKVDSVNVDFSGAMQNAIKLLINYGHRNITFFGEANTKSKAKTFNEATINKRHCEFNTIISDKRFENAGKDCATKFLSGGLNSTAVICAYDNIAIGAIKEFKKHGINVPDDISVIGIDNIVTGQYVDTTLTTIDTYPEEICEVAWNLLLKKMKNPYYKSTQNIEIVAKLIVRESVKSTRN